MDLDTDEAGSKNDLTDRVSLKLLKLKHEVLSWSHGTSRRTTFISIVIQYSYLQAASSSLFGLGTQQTKCVRQFVTKEITTNSMTNILKLVRLVWVDNRTVVLLTVDGSETKYSV